MPFNNSALTKILKNALGGNSKTIMICAVSPSAANYDESLGTLRYADNAKKIKNKAIVNESAQDKVVRELRDENAKLKERIMELEKNGSIPAALIAETGVPEIEDSPELSKD